MAAPFHVSTIENCLVSPPPDSAIPSITLPLTFLDIPWLLYKPNQTLLFFPKPPPKTTITTVTTLLKHSLSLTLHHFHPLAGNLVSPPPPAEPYILYTKGDSITFTIAESNTTINHLSGHHPKHISNLYSLLPKLPNISMSRDTHVANDNVNVNLIPLLAIQVTVFTDFGYSIGVTTQPVAADERTLDQFIKSWASVCLSLLKKESFFVFKSTPWFDRSVFSDENSLKMSFLKQWWGLLNSTRDSSKENDYHFVKSTFVLKSSDMNMIKQHIVTKCMMMHEDPPVHLSPYVSACSYIWICLSKVQESVCTKDGPMYLGFNAGGITRLGFQVPASYLGSCIAFGRCMVMKTALMGDDGIVFAAKSLGKEIKRLDMDVLGGGDRWICNWKELDIRVVGSPKVDSYGLDFGWGKVEKVEKMSSDDYGKVNVVSLCESRDFKGGMEIGMVLSKEKMSAFTSLFNGGLVALS
uniref:Anthocyanidin 3-O-glucoside 6''-O-acyltransferase n=1 Tax=Zinnia elegans TaxID=34245 RepID=A0A8K1N837_ZINEL|nr:anthocyanidin 3-O-glucoside 6''-O-acyltransferase [Zinnia elegans]